MRPWATTHCSDPRQRTTKGSASGMDSEKLNWTVTVRPCTQPLPVGKSKNPAGSGTVPPAAGDADSRVKVPVGAGGSDGDMPSSPQDSVSPEAKRRARAFRFMYPLDREKALDDRCAPNFRSRAKSRQYPLGDDR